MSTMPAVERAFAPVRCWPALLARDAGQARLVERELDARDRRKILVVLTVAGRRALSAIKKQARRHGRQEGLGRRCVECDAAAVA